MQKSLDASPTVTNPFNAPQEYFHETSVPGQPQPDIESFASHQILSQYPANNLSSVHAASTQPAWKSYLIGALIAGLCLFIGYQQMQINRLSRDVGTLTHDMKTSDVPMRLDALDDKQDEMNSRLSYLDSKIAATDQKAQSALEQVKAQEKAGNFVGEFFNSLGKSLGLNR